MGKNGLTIVCEAIKFDNLAMIRACIEHGASLSGTITVAVDNRHIHLIEMLVKAGADINERDEYGNTPLRYVVGTALPGEEGSRNRKLRALLIKLGATDARRKGNR
jgi:ankyrin repeat protein